MDATVVWPMVGKGEVDRESGVPWKSNTSAQGSGSGSGASRTLHITLSLCALFSVGVCLETVTRAGKQPPNGMPKRGRRKAWALVSRERA